MGDSGGLWLGYVGWTGILTAGAGRARRLNAGRPREGGDPVLKVKYWIPARAGMSGGFVTSSIELFRAIAQLVQ